MPLRIDAEERAALENLSKVEGRPVNQLLNEAIKSYLRRRQEEGSLKPNLAGLLDYQTHDPGFRRAIDAFVEAEAGLADPVEGAPIDGEFIDGEFKPAGPVQRRIREILGT